MNLCFQKEKTLRKCVFIQPQRYIIIYFASLFYPYMQIPLQFQQIPLETKMLPLISQMLAFLGTLFIIILTIKIF